MRKYRFCLRPSQSPTFYNIARYLLEGGWCYTRFNCLSNVSEKQFHFNQAAAEFLEYKHLLAQLIYNYCPHVMPETYCVNDENWSRVLGQLADKYYMKNGALLDNVDNLAWILKPSLLNNGQHIKIFQHVSQLEQHYIQSNRLGGEHVLQRYLIEPHLLKGHKYSIRLFVVLTNYAGAYLYPEGYFNVARYPYQPRAFDDLRQHITNEHLQDNEINVIQIPTTQFDFFPLIFQQIKSIVLEVVNGLKGLEPSAFYCKKQRTLAIFGFDFMVDANKHVWLLEANHGPCFPIDDEHPLQKHLYVDFWRDFIASFVVPIATRQSVETIQYRGFVNVDFIN